MKPVVFHRLARAELDRATGTISNARPGYGARFLAEYADAEAKFIADPLRYPVAINDVRGCAMRSFRYTIYYAELPDRIWIAAVAHQHRRPYYWRRRRPNDV